MAIDYHIEDSPTEVMTGLLDHWMDISGETYESSWMWLKKHWAKYNRISQADCRGMNRFYDEFVLGKTCNRFACPSCWYKHQIALFESIQACKGLSYLITLTDTSVPNYEILDKRIIKTVSRPRLGMSAAYTYGWLDKGESGNCLFAMSFGYSQHGSTENVSTRLSRVDNCQMPIKTFMYADKSEAVTHWIDLLEPPWVSSFNEDTYKDLIDTTKELRNWSRVGLSE